MDTVFKQLIFLSVLKKVPELGGVGEFILYLISFQKRKNFNSVATLIYNIHSFAGRNLL